MKSGELSSILHVLDTLITKSATYESDVIRCC